MSFGQKTSKHITTHICFKLGCFAKKTGQPRHIVLIYFSLFIVYYRKLVVSKIRTCIVGVEGENADLKTTTKA